MACGRQENERRGRVKTCPGAQNTVSRVTAGPCTPTVTFAWGAMAAQCGNEPEQITTVVVGVMIVLFPARKHASSQRVAEQQSVAIRRHRDCERSSLLWSKGV